MKKNIRIIPLAILMFMALSMVGCGGGGGGSTPATNNNNNPPTNALPTVKDSAWTEINRSPVINKMVFVGSKYIAVGKYGFIGESTDAQTWTEYDAGTAIEFADLAVASNGTNIIAISQSNTGMDGFAVTTNGTTWQYYDRSQASNCFNPIDIIYDGSQFVGVFNGNEICTSTDGSSWQLQTTLNGFSLKQLAYGNSIYAFSLAGGGLITKTALNDTSTTLATFPGSCVTCQLGDMIYGSSAFVGYDLGGGLYYSTDGNNWSAVTSPVVYGVQALSYSTSSGFVAVNGSVAYSSTDGISWSAAGGTNQPIISSTTYDYLANGSTETFMYDDNGRFYSSSDLTSWTQTAAKPLMTPGAFLNQNGVLYYANDYNATEGSSGLYRSTDNGGNWTVIDAQAGGVQDIMHDGTQFVISGLLGLSYSSDGISWTSSLSSSFSSPSVSAKAGSTTYYFISNYIGGTSAYQYQALSSTDNIDFQLVNGLVSAITGAGGITGNIKQAVSNGSTVVAISSNDIISYNANASNAWAIEASSTTNVLSKIAWTGSEFIVVGAAGTVMTSTDGASWTTQTWVNTVSGISDVTAVGSTLYALDSARYITSSTNGGVSWAVFEDLNASSLSGMYIAADTDTNKLYVFGQTTSGGAAMVYNGVSWSSVLSASDVVPGPVIYESANQRFLSLSNDGTNTILTSALGNTWTAVSTAVTDPAFAHVYAKSNLSKAGFGFGPIQYTAGSPGSYASGFAYSNDAQNWSINTSQIPYPGYTPASGIYANTSSGISTSTDAINYSAATITGMASSTPSVLYMKYVNGQYISTTSNGNGKRGIYTSANGSDWTLLIELSGDSFSQWSGSVADLEYDGTQYLFLFHDQTKGAMIMTSSDMQNFTIHETGIKSSARDLILESSGFRITGGDGVIATHAAY